MLRQSHWRWRFQGQPKLHSWNPSHKVELLDLVTISHRPNLTGCLYSCQGEFTTCRNYINTMPLPWWPHFLSSLSGVYLLNPSLARTAPVQALGVMVPKEALALSSQIRWLLRPQLLVFLLARASRFGYLWIPHGQQRSAVSAYSLGTTHEMITPISISQKPQPVPHMAPCCNLYSPQVWLTSVHLHLLASGPHLFTTLHPLNWYHMLFPCGKLFSEWASRCQNFHLH